MTISHRQGAYVVLRDDKGRAIGKVLETGKPKQTARAALRKLSNDLLDYYMVLDQIARGIPHVVELPDGRVSAPIIPSADVRRQAAKDLIEFADGKAVSQTDILQAESQQQQLAQLESMSDAQLWELVEVKRKALSVPDEPTPDSSAEGHDE